MSGICQHDWPSNEKLLTDLDACAGRTTMLAEHLGVSRGALEARIRKQGLRPQLEEIRAQHRKAPAARAIPVTPGEAVSREETLLAENKELRAALSQTRGDEVAQERVIDALKEGISAAAVTYKPRARAASGKQQPHTLTLLLSDAHAGERVSLEETNGLNEYDWTIMLQRLRKLAEGVRSHRDHYGAHARRLHICSLGDGLSGSIHEELKETNDPPFAEAIIRYGVDIGEWIATEFASEFEEITMDCVVGNHPRFSVKPRAKVAYDNGDWISSEVTRLYLRGHGHITVRAPKAKQTVVEVCKRQILLVHGDGVRTTMQGVPWGGIIRQSDKLKQLFDLADVNVEHVFTGHWHNPQVAEDFAILVNGSIKGVDEYSIAKYGGGKPPSQLLVAFDDKHGITGVHRIDL